MPAGRHVVIVGISGLRWAFATPATTPTLWRLAEAGSVGALVDYAQQPVACPDDGWLALNGGARAEGPRPCAALPPVLSEGTGARIPAMPVTIVQNTTGAIRIRTSLMKPSERPVQRRRS